MHVIYIYEMISEPRRKWKRGARMKKEWDCPDYCAPSIVRGFGVRCELFDRTVYWKRLGTKSSNKLTKFLMGEIPGDFVMRIVLKYWKNPWCFTTSFLLAVYCMSNYLRMAYAVILSTLDFFHLFRGAINTCWNTGDTGLHVSNMSTSISTSIA